MRARTAPIGPRLNLDAIRDFGPERPPALLLGGGLNLIRPLGFAGIPAIVASPYPRDPTIASRYCSGHFLIPQPQDADAAAEVLLQSGERLASAFGCRIPLLYGNDDYLNLIYSYREQFERHFLFLLNEPDVARALIEKDRFAMLAQLHGLTLPRTLAWDGTGRDALSRAEGPVVVKPKVKLGWDDSIIYLQLLGGHGKARVFGNGREVMAHPLVCRVKDQLAFQEFIAGDDRHLWSFHGFADEKGSLLTGFVGRKLRTFPALTGMSTFLELVHHDELAAIGRDIVTRVPLKGVFKIDFKQDIASGRFYLLEINARFNLWHHMAARNGINLPQVAYDYLVRGTRPEETQYRTAFRWLDFRVDYRAYRELASRDELNFGDWVVSLFASRKVYDLFSWTDPAPFLLCASDRAKSLLQRWLTHSMTWLRQWLSTA